MKASFPGVFLFPKKGGMFMTENKKLFLYEALELRAEYDGRIKTIKDCLPETRRNRDRFSLTREDDGKRRPSPDFNVADVRKQLRKLEVKRRKLNSAIQRANFNHRMANFNHRIEFDGELINLNEALEARKGLNVKIGELHTQVVNSAYQRIIYKEDRDIVEENELSYTECVNDLEIARLDFRALNRKLQSVESKASQGLF
jgi:hypothetical protein